MEMDGAERPNSKAGEAMNGYLFGVLLVIVIVAWTLLLIDRGGI